MKEFAKIGGYLVVVGAILYLGARITRSRPSLPTPAGSAQKKDAESIALSNSDPIPVDICRHPLRLSIGQVDPQFSLERAALAAAVGKAAAEWNDATGRHWFQFVDTGGIAVNLLFDGRQESLQQRSDEERKIAEAIAALNRIQQDLRTEEDVLHARASQWESSRNAYEAQAAVYNSRVVDISRNEAIDQEEALALEQERRKLAGIQRTLEEARQDLGRLQGETLRKAEQVHAQEVQIQNQLSDFKARFPPIPFKEAEHIRGALVNEINIYAVTDLEELHRALLHEMGHAIGLAHSVEIDSIMAPQHEIGSGSTNLTAGDVNAALNVCPVD
jgi:hypothetical protein